MFSFFLSLVTSHSVIDIPLIVLLFSVTNTVMCKNPLKPSVRHYHTFILGVGHNWNTRDISSSCQQISIVFVVCKKGTTYFTHFQYTYVPAKMFIFFNRTQVLRFSFIQLQTCFFWYFRNYLGFLTHLVFCMVFDMHLKMRVH